MSFRAGDVVVATKDFGGIARPAVPAGSRGVVTEVGFFGGPVHVVFTIKSFFGEKKVETTADRHEIA